ncbi:MAG: hypothetical protein ABIQ86_02090 [Steroidobacteraceae bacterium]
MREFLTLVHECADFDKWKADYDADAGNRQAAGLTDLVLVRQADRPNVIALIFEVSDSAKAMAFVTSRVLREVMQKAGITGAPDVHFRRGEFTVPDSSQYLTVNCRVRDFETFRKAYAADKADRLAAGLTDVGVLRDANDPTNLLLLWSIDDMAKAKSFLESPALAEHQTKNAGLIGEPIPRFWRP